MAKYESPYVEYRDDEKRVFTARPIQPDEYPSVQRVREQDYERRFVETGFATPREVRRYIKLIESKSGVGEPGDPRRLGLFYKGRGGEQLVAFQYWGIDTQEPHRETHALLQEIMGELAIDAMSSTEIDMRIGYTESRCTAVQGERYGNTVRHAATVAMQQAGLVIVGKSVFESDTVGYVSENEKLKPKYLRRRDSAVEFPMKSSSDPSDTRHLAFRRTQLYVGVNALQAYLEQKHEWLAEGRENME